MIRHIILLGAARSGTKILRDVLAAATGAGCVPYDIGFVWRYGQPDTVDDSLDPETLTPRIKRFIMRYVDRYAAGSPTKTVIEKTVGNTLRVPFVHAVFPDAAYVHLVRDGVDVAESTRRQWREPADPRYLLQKARHFPVRLAPSYGRKYVATQLHRYFGRDARVGSWGPRYPGMEDDVRTQDLLAVCARQWRESVDRASAALGQLSAPVATVRYETLVTEPETTLVRLLSSLGMPHREDAMKRAVAMLEPGHTGLGGRTLTATELRLLEANIAPTLHRLGYPSPTSRHGSGEGTGEDSGTATSDNVQSKWRHHA